MGIKRTNEISVNGIADLRSLIIQALGIPVPNIGRGFIGH